MLNNKKKGFLLTEVLVGLLIISLIVAFILPNIQRAMFLQKKTEKQIEQVYYLKSVMSRMKSNIRLNKDIEFGIEDHEKFKYEYSMEEVRGLKKLTVGVEDHGQKVELEVYLNNTGIYIN